MFWIFFVLAIFSLCLYFGYRSGKNQHQEWQRKNYRAYEEFLANDHTMTEHEKQKAHLWFMLTGQITQPYSGKKFEILSKE